jgi:hypothetical protein
MKVKELSAYRKTNYLQYGYEEVLVAAKPIFEELIDSLIRLPEDAPEAERLFVFQCCVESLNKLDRNEALMYGIDTIEREEFCEKLYQIGKIVGLDPKTDFVDNWRDW